MITKILELTSCQKCEHFRTKPEQCDDDFNYPDRWYCNTDPTIIIASYQEWNDPDPGIPERCPLQDKNILNH